MRGEVELSVAKDPRAVAGNSRGRRLQLDSSGPWHPSLATGSNGDGRQGPIEHQLMSAPGRNRKKK